MSIHKIENMYQQFSFNFLKEISSFQCGFSYFLAQLMSWQQGFQIITNSFEKIDNFSFAAIFHQFAFFCELLGAIYIALSAEYNCIDINQVRRKGLKVGWDKYMVDIIYPPPPLPPPHGCNRVKVAEKKWLAGLIPTEPLRSARPVILHKKSDYLVKIK